MIFETVFECRNRNRVILPLNPDWKVLGISMSGGADSTLLAYLTAQAIQKNNLKTQIRPISCDFGTKPSYLPTVRRIKTKITELLGFEQWAEPYEFKIPLRESIAPAKKYAVTNHIKALCAIGHIDFEFNGVTRNPPGHIRSNFTNDFARELDRDEKCETIYSGKFLAKPMSFTDKQGVVELYRQLGLLETLFPLTLSCDVNLEHMENGKLPCGKCWWCDERRWALEANGERLDL